jgi:hypothetical protein
MCLFSTKTRSPCLKKRKKKKEIKVQLQKGLGRYVLVFTQNKKPASVDSIQVSLCQYKSKWCSEKTVATIMKECKIWGNLKKVGELNFHPFRG